MGNSGTIRSASRRLRALLEVEEAPVRVECLQFLQLLEPYAAAAWTVRTERLLAETVRLLYRVVALGSGQGAAQDLAQHLDDIDRLPASSL